MSKRYQILDSKSVLKAGVFEFIADQVEYPSGKNSTHYTVKHPGAVVVIPQMDDGDLLIIEQYRHSLGRSILELPAGTLEVGEPALACAKREIVEEIGHRARNWLELGCLFPAPGFCDEVQHLFLARGLSEARADGDEDEIIDVHKVSLAEIDKLIKSGEFSDAKSLAALMRARLLEEL